MQLDNAQRLAITERVRDALALIPNLPKYTATPYHGAYECVSFSGYLVDWYDDGSVGRFHANEDGTYFVSTCTQENSLYNRLGLKAKIESIFENVMRKHKDLQFLCDSFETARPHIPFKLQSHIVEDADGKPSLIVHRVHNEASVLLGVVSVKFDGSLFVWCCSTNAHDGFDAFARPLCFPENYVPKVSAK